MDSKKIIEKLIKIAEKQQKIINKLAQVNGEPPANNLAINAPKHMRPVEALKAKILANPTLKGNVVQVELEGQDLVVVFQRGKSRTLWNDALKAKSDAEADQTLLPGYGISSKEV